MRKPILTNKVLRGLRILSRLYEDTKAGDFMCPPEVFPNSEEREDAQRAREWIAGMVEWWRETHEKGGLTRSPR